jgi:hypothetical protein
VIWTRFCRLGPPGRLNLNGIFSDVGLWQSNHVPGAAPTQAALSNGRIFIGSLPTLIRAEHTFTFRNMNIVRGLLWDQESAVSREPWRRTVFWLATISAESTEAGSRCPRAS